MSMPSRCRAIPFTTIVRAKAAGAEMPMLRIQHGEHLNGYLCIRLSVNDHSTTKVTTARPSVRSRPTCHRPTLGHRTTSMEHLAKATTTRRLALAHTNTTARARTLISGTGKSRRQCLRRSFRQATPMPSYFPARRFALRFACPNHFRGHLVSTSCCAFRKSAASRVTHSPF